MEIKDFILQTIKEIESALKGASSERVYYEIDTHTSKGIHFNLAVTNSSIDEKTGKKGAGARIKVIEAELGKSDRQVASLESVSRIEFNIIGRSVSGGPVKPEYFEGL